MPEKLNDSNGPDDSQFPIRARSRATMRLRNYLLTGLIITGPIAITVYLTWALVEWVDSIVKPLVPAIYNPDTYLPFSVPGFGLVVAFAGLVVVGFLTANFAGRTLLAFGESLLGRMPLVRNLYRALKQIFETVLAERSSSFKRAVLIEYPRRGLWAIGFLATDAKGEVAHHIADPSEIVAVFLPTTPNPTSGFLLFVPRRDLTELTMSVEEAAKLVISAGLVNPDWDPEKATPSGQPTAIAPSNS